MAYTLVSAYQEFSSILADLKEGKLGYFAASDKLHEVASAAKRDIPGTNLEVPSIMELKALHPTASIDEEYESSEEPYESSEEYYESSYESSAC